MVEIMAIKTKVLMLIYFEPNKISKFYFSNWKLKVIICIAQRLEIIAAIISKNASSPLRNCIYLMHPEESVRLKIEQLLGSQNCCGLRLICS